MKKSTGHVIVVDDDPATRAFLAMILSTEGFDAIPADDGLEALYMLRTVRQRARSVPCLVLLDLMMPRLSGTGFRRAQLGDPTVSDVPIAVMSGAVNIEERAKTLGAVAILHKPLDAQALLAVVRRHCS